MSIGASLIPKIIRVTVPCTELGTLTYMGRAPIYPILHSGPDIIFYGTSYHEDNSSIGSWVGVPRGKPITDELISLVRKLENAKRSSDGTVISEKGELS